MVDLVKKKDHFSANNALEFMDGGSNGPHVCTSNNILPCIVLERGEQRRGKRRVLDLHGYSHRLPDGFGKWLSVIPITDDCRRWKVTDEKTHGAVHIV